MPWTVAGKTHVSMEGRVSHRQIPTDTRSVSDVAVVTAMAANVANIESVARAIWTL